MDRTLCATSVINDALLPGIQISCIGYTCACCVAIAEVLLSARCSPLLALLKILGWQNSLLLVSCKPTAHAWALCLI